MEKLGKILRESILEVKGKDIFVPRDQDRLKGLKFQVIFYNSGMDDEIPVENIRFNTKEEGEKWADALEYDYQDIAMDDDGNDYWKTFYRYYNPEDKQNYEGYDVRLAPDKVNEVTGKDIFVPRNPDRFQDLKKPWIDKGYKSEEIHYGDIGAEDENEELLLNSSNLKIVIGTVDLANNDDGIERFNFDLDEVTGSFWCNDNPLISLKGSPKKVGGNFNCHGCNLKTLEGGPEYVDKTFACYDNPLISLKGAPKYVGNDFSCEMTNIKSLDGIGKVDGKIYSDVEEEIIENKLNAKDIFVPRNPERQDDVKKPWLDKGYKREQIFVGEPEDPKQLIGIKVVIGNVNAEYGEFNGVLPFDLDEVTGNFDCSWDHLTSLKGCPKKVGGNFYCYGNRLTTLEGGPEYVGGNFDCQNNKLTTLKGLPKEIGGWANIFINDSDFTEEYIRSLSNIKGTVYVTI